MTFILVGEDPKLATIVESSDFHYLITDQFKVIYRIELTIKENVDSQPWSITFHFQYMRPNFEKLKEAIAELCHYVNQKGATLEAHFPPNLTDPETKPFDQEKSNSYGQGSVTQPYHSPAQIAAAAQGNLHPSFHVGNQHNLNYHQPTPNGIYHQPSNQHSHLNGFHGHPQQQPNQHFGRGYPPMGLSNYGGNRGSMNNSRHGGHHHGLYQPPGYQTYNRGANHHMNHYNSQPFGPNNGTNGYQRRYMHNPPTPTGETTSPGGYPPQISRTGGMVVGQSPLDTLSSIELPDISGNGYRTHQEGHTPTPPNGAYHSPSAQSYFPPQPNNVHHNGFSHQGYPSGHVGGRYQS